MPATFARLAFLRDRTTRRRNLSEDNFVAVTLQKDGGEIFRNWSLVMADSAKLWVTPAREWGGEAQYFRLPPDNFFGSGVPFDKAA